MPSVALQQVSADDRALPRYRLMTEVTARLDGPAAHLAVLHNISATGLLIEVDLPLATGTTVVVDLPGSGEVEAEVAWSHAQFHGAAFARPLAAAAVRSALAESKVVWPTFNPTPHHRAPSPPIASVEVEQVPTLSPARRVQAMLLMSGLLWAGIGAIGWAALT